MTEAERIELAIHRLTTEHKRIADALETITLCMTSPTVILNPPHVWNKPDRPVNT